MKENDHYNIADKRTTIITGRDRARSRAKKDLTLCRRDGKIYTPNTGSKGDGGVEMAEWAIVNTTNKKQPPLFRIPFGPTNHTNSVDCCQDNGIQADCARAKLLRYTTGE